MPHTTFGYPFELKVLNFAQGMYSGVAGLSADQSWLLELDSEGEPRSLYKSYPGGRWKELTDRLDEEGASYLFYDPFDVPEYTWLSWKMVDRDMMERLTGANFVESVFVKFGKRMYAVQDLGPPGELPSSWQTMF